MFFSLLLLGGVLVWWGSYGDQSAQMINFPFIVNNQNINYKDLILVYGHQYHSQVQIQIIKPSDSKLLLFPQRLQQNLQAFLVYSQYLIQLFPVLPQLGAKSVISSKSLDYPPANLHLLLFLYHEKQILVQFEEMGVVEKGERAFQVGGGNLLYQFEQKGRLFFILNCLNNLLAVLQILIPCLDVLFFELIHCVFLYHHFLHVLLLLVPSDSLIVTLLPNSKPSVKSPSDYIISSRCHCEGPNFKQTFVQIDNQLMRICVPKLDMPVFAARQDVMRLPNELDCSYRFCMSKNRLDAMPEIQVPNSYVFIDTSGYQKRVIR